MTANRIECEYSKLVKVSDLKDHYRNMNSHPDEQIERLAKIIEYQGMRSPIVVSNLSGCITKGHGRKLALIKLGWDEAPVDFQNYDSEEQEYADICADNAIASWASLDLSKINMDIVDFGPELDLDMLGLKEFTVEPLDKLEIEDDDIEKPKEYVIEVKFPNDMEMMDIHDDLISRGYISRVK